MAGHMGDRQVTVQNLEVVRTDAERGLILIGARCRAPRAAWLLIRDAVKRPAPEDLPLPAAIRRAPAPAPDTRRDDCRPAERRRRLRRRQSKE